MPATAEKIQDAPEMEIEAGFEPTPVYHPTMPNTKVKIEDAPGDPQLSRFLKFDGGVCLAKSRDELAFLSALPGTFVADIPAGQPAAKCPQNGCLFSARNKDAVMAHVKRWHLD